MKIFGIIGVAYIYFCVMCFADDNISEWKVLEKELISLQERGQLKTSEILKIGFFENLDKSNRKKSVLLEMSLLANYPNIQHATFLYAKNIKDPSLSLEICLNVLFSQKLPNVNQDFTEELLFLKKQKEELICNMMIKYLRQYPNWRKVIEIVEWLDNKTIAHILKENAEGFPSSSLAALLFVWSRDLKNMTKHDQQKFSVCLQKLSGVPGNPQAVFFLFSKKKNKVEYDRLLNDENVDRSLKAAIRYDYKEKKE